MGEVYRAEDTKLGREVAIKVLPEAVAADPERLARFEREAKVLASLNHPHIAAIYSLESVTGYSFPGAQQAGANQEMSSLSPKSERPVHFLVMELVDGPTLQELIEQGVPTDEALAIAADVAEALEEAHDRGIIHRDLKPANIKIAPGGKVKVLDFGLAKALDPRDAGSGGSNGVVSPGSPAMLSLSPTLTAQMTQAGVLLGTAAYMSPEQARGQVVDRRTDIWAFGCVVYEMLGGGRLFDGPSVTDVLASVIRADIDLDKLPADVPRSVRELVARCLDRDPKTRLRDIGEARITLRSLPEETPSKAGATTDERPQSTTRRGLGAIAATLVVGVAAGLGIGLLGPWRAPTASPRTASAPRQLVLPIPDRTLGEPPRSAPFGQAISPDGRWVAYINASGLWLRRLSELEPRPVPESSGARGVFWSPSSDAVAFSVGDRLYKFLLDSGRPTELCQLASGDFTGGTWSPTEGIVVTLARANWDGDVLRVPVDGGEPEIFTVTDAAKGERRFFQPFFLPGGESLLYSMVSPDANDGEVVLDRGGIRTRLGLGNGSVQGAWSPTGHIVFTRTDGFDTALWALPFSLETLEPTGEAFRLLEGAASATVAADGTILLEVRHPEPQQLVRVDRSGRILGDIGEPLSDQISTLAISHDGRHVGASVNWTYIWVWDVERSLHTRITPDGEKAMYPEWLPGDTEIAYPLMGGDGGIVVRRADGGGASRSLVDMPGAVVPNYSTDGRYAVFYVVDRETARDLWALDTDKPDEPFVVLQTPDNEAMPRLSPDGTLLAYQSDTSGRWEVYVQTFPGGESRWQVSVEGGQSPRWNPVGGELFFVNGDDLMVATVTIETPGSAQPRVRFGTPTRLFSGSDLGTRLSQPRNIEHFYDVAPDGQSLIVVKGIERGEGELVLATGLLEPGG